MRRLLVLGGTGFFGSLVVERLRADGLDPIVASRRTGLDVENRSTLRPAIHPGDVVVDAAGPFQDRTTALIESALERGADVVDLSDSLDYAERVTALASRIDRAGLRVLTSCSSVAAITAAAVRLTGFRDPTSVRAFLAPASRHTTTEGTFGSLIRTIGRPVRVLSEGRLVARPAWSTVREFPFPPPVGPARGHLLESADALLLPRAWPSLRTIEFYVDLRRPPVNAAIGMASRFSPLRKAAWLARHFGLAVARRFGARSGGFGIEIGGAEGVRRVAFVAEGGSFAAAAVPAALAAKVLAEGRFPYRGLVPPDRYVDPDELTAHLARLGIRRDIF